MPGGVTRWNDKWLDKVDDNGVLVGKWCKSVKGKNDFAYCTLCYKEFSVKNSGFKQVQQHCKTSKHKQISDARFKNDASSQKLLFVKSNYTVGSDTFEATVASTSLSSASCTVAFSKELSESKRKTNENVFLAPSLKNQVSESELLWCYKVASSDFSFRSCDNIGKLFHKMFKCQVAEHFSLSRTKASYIVSEAVIPYLLGLL